MKHTSIIKRKEIPEFSLSGSIRIGHISTPVSYEWIPMKTEKREAIMKHFMKRTVYTAGISAAVAAAALGLGGCAAGTQMPDTLKVQNVDAAENVITVTGREEVKVTTNLTVSDIPIDNAGTIITKSVAAGVNGINSVSYFSSSYDASYQEALKGAMAVAQAKAQALAEAGAKTLAGVVHVEEFGYQPDTRYASYNSGGSAKMAAVALEDAGAPVMPGQVSVEAQVTVSYELNE